MSSHDLLRTLQTDDDRVDLLEWDDRVHRLGRYILLHRVGRGSWGVVRAAYDPQLDRRLAIKIVSRGAESTRDNERLLLEARHLARLSHPNIVAVHDVGYLEDIEEVEGIYIVMEFLGGPDLSEWLAQKQRSVAEILAVFRDLGLGLAVAHEDGLVHRDFKLDNLRFGADGRIRILDFGLARLAKSLDTGVGASGTPAYMAPEQHDFGTPDAAVDQYAFCVSLWESLVGSRPFLGDNASTLKVAKLRGVEDVPSPPSDRCPEWIAAILRRGLEPNPKDRYPDMRALLAALADDPAIRRRRRLRVGAVALALVGAGFAVSSSMRDQANSCEVPQEALDKVWSEDARARVAASFARTNAPYADAALAETERALDAYLDAWSATRTHVCEQAIEDRGQLDETTTVSLSCLDGQLGAVGALTASLQHANETTILHAADSVAELPNPSDCVIERRTSTGSPDPRLRTRVLAVEDLVVRARASVSLSHIDEGLELITGAITEAEALGDSASLARAQLVHGRLLRENGDYDEAEAALLAAIAAATTADDDESYSRALVALIALDITRGEIDDAERIASIAEARVIYVSTDVRIELAYKRGLIAIKQREWDLALSHIDRAQEMATEYYGPRHLRIAAFESARGTLYSASHRSYERALDHHQRALEIYRERYGDVHPRVASVFNNIGVVYYRRGDFAQAIEHMGASLAIHEKTRPPGHPALMRQLDNLAAAQSEFGDLDQAIELARRARAMRAVRDASYAHGESNLGDMLIQRGDHREALQVFESARTLHSESSGADSPAVVTTEAQLARVAWELGDSATFEAHMARTIEGFASVADDDPRHDELVGLLARLHLMAGDPDAALPFAERRLANASERHGPDHEVSAGRQAIVAEVLNALARFELARDHARAGLAVIEQGPKRWPLELADADAAASLGLGDEARSAYERVVEGLTNQRRDPVVLARALLGLAQLVSDDDPRASRAHARACLERLEPLGLRPDIQATCGALAQERP